jgi:Tfp pilus assembly protein PilE
MRPTGHHRPARRAGTILPRSERGFTISELVLVVAVVGALIFVAVWGVSGIGKESTERECRDELRAIKAATEQFYAELNFYPPNDKALKDANLLAPEDTPNYRVVTPDGATKPRYELEGTRCK